MWLASVCPLWVCLGCNTYVCVRVSSAGSLLCVGGLLGEGVVKYIVAYASLSPYLICYDYVISPSLIKNSHSFPVWGKLLQHVLVSSLGMKQSLEEFRKAFQLRCQCQDQLVCKPCLGQDLCRGD